MNSRVLALVVAFTLALCVAAPITQVAAQQKGKEPQVPKEMLGCWKNDANGNLLRIENPRFTVLSEKEGLWFAKFLKYEKGILYVRNNGSEGSFGAAVKEGKLVFSYGEGEKDDVFTKLDKVPPEVDVKPFTFGKPKAVPPAKLKEVQDELAKRLVEDQAVRTDPARGGDMGKVDADNTAYLKNMTAEFGWIDNTRFGADAATVAFLIVQHSGDIPLMMAALPCIEKDLKAKVGDPQDYALLFDRLQLRLGEKQRYGTQIGSDDDGTPLVFALEDRAKVEQFRKEIGLFPLSQYLEIFKQQSGAKEIRFADDKKDNAGK